MLSSYADVMSSMLGSQEANAVDKEAMVSVPIDPSRQIYRLIPENQEFTPKDAARELGKASFVDKRNARAERFLQQSKYEQATSLSKLIASQRTQADDTGGSATAPLVSRTSRSQYTIKDIKGPRTVIRTRSGDLQEMVLPENRKNTRVKWKSPTIQ